MSYDDAPEAALPVPLSAVPTGRTVVVRRPTPRDRLIALADQARRAVAHPAVAGSVSAAAALGAVAGVHVVRRAVGGAALAQTRPPVGLGGLPTLVVRRQLVVQTVVESVEVWRPGRR